MTRVRTAVAAIALCAGALAAAEVPLEPRTVSDWPGWRGPASDGSTTGDGVFSGPFRLEVRWRRALGSGYSAVSVADGHAVTQFSDGERDFLVSLSAESGEERWRVPLGPTWPGREGANDGPISTPALHSGVAYALAPRGDLIAVELSEGQVRWRRQLAEEIGAAVPHWGFGGSPLVHDEMVIVATGGLESPAVTAFDRDSGRTIWRSAADESSYQSPIVVGSSDDEPILVAGGDHLLLFLDPRTGRELGRWKHGGEGFYRRIINPLVLTPDLLLLTHQPDAGSAVTFGTHQPEVRWTTPDLKGSYATPVLHAGHVFGYSGNFLTCVDAKTGELRWKSRSPGNGFPIVVDGHVVVQTKDGVLAVAEAIPDGFIQKAELKLFENLAWTPPSFAGGRIYARDSYSEIAAVDVVPLATSEEGGVSETGPQAGKLPESRFAKWVQATEGRPDATERVGAFLGGQRGLPLIEDDRIVHFLYHGEVEDLAINGSLFEYGDQMPMHRVEGTDLYYASFETEPDARHIYQFVADFERVTDPGNPLTSRSMHFQGDVSILRMPASRSTEVPVAERRGRVVDLPFETDRIRVGSKTWGGPRSVRVYLPASYDDSPDLRFPTVYVLYGSRLLDHSRLGERLDAALGGSVAPVVVVLVQSISPYEYARTQREVHGRMLSETLVPLIDSRFRTQDDAEQRAVLGAHEGGYAAVEAGLRFPDVFGKVGALSVFPVGKGDEDLLREVDRFDGDSLRFYLDWGTHDPYRRRDRTDVPAFSRRLRDRLLEKGHLVTAREWHDGSDLELWSQRSIDALEALFPN